MEIRCAECEHVGPAASVAPSAAGVALVCENCGHENLLSVPNAPADSAEATPAVPVTPTPRPARSPADVSADGWLTKGALERLIPEVGAGGRCKKCAQLLPNYEENCPRCGLSMAESFPFKDGEAPWERAPAGMEAAFDQASLLWNSVADNPTDDNITKFAEFVREEELLEFGIRKLRFFLVDHVGHDAATQELKRLAGSFQAKMIVARAKAELRADNIVATTVRVRSVILAVVLVIFTSIFLVFLSQVIGAGC